MPRKMGRNYLNLCFIKIKSPITTQSSAITPASHTTDRDQTRLFSTTTTTATATATTFIKNYNSLYEYTSSKSFSSSSSSDDDPKAYTAVDFVTAFTSHRFFFSSPGRSNSIIESTTSSSSSYTTSDSGELLFHNSMAIPTISPDPYADFRQSMQEMVESLEQIDGNKSRWEFLHELLLCYLALNPKNTHKYILGAFADLAGMIKPPLVPPCDAICGSGDREL